MRGVLSNHLQSLGFTVVAGDGFKGRLLRHVKKINDYFRLVVVPVNGKDFVLYLSYDVHYSTRRHEVTWYEFTDRDGWDTLHRGMRQLEEVAECLTAKNPRCPRCGFIMMDRVMLKEGHPHFGEAFWSCACYPECKGMVAHWKDVDMEDGMVLDSVNCPTCGSSMVARRARRGEHAGEIFYGCVRYPACKGALSEGAAVALAFKK